MAKATSQIIKKWENYTFKLYEGTSTKTHIFYNFFNPEKGKNERVKSSIGLTNLTGIKLVQEATALVDDIIELLKKGYNPITGSIIEENDINSKSSILECLENFISFRKELKDMGELSSGRFIANHIFYNFFKEWLIDNNYTFRKAESFNQIELQNFLTLYKIKRKWKSKHSYNQYRNDLILLFNYLKKKEVIKDNKAEKTDYAKGVDHDQTHYTVFEDDELVDVITKLKSDDRYKNLYLGSKMLYNMMIRPDELLRLQLKHYEPKTQILTLPKEITKNGNDAFFQVDEEIHNLIISSSNESENFIIGGGKQRLAFGYLGQKWRKFRKEFNIPEHLKFYALKHTSSYNLIDDGESVSALSQRLRHASERTTRRYVGSKLKKKVITPLKNSKF